MAKIAHKCTFFIRRNQIGHHCPLRGSWAAALVCLPSEMHAIRGRDRGASPGSFLRAEKEEEEEGANFFGLGRSTMRPKAASTHSLPPACTDPFVNPVSALNALILNIPQAGCVLTTQPKPSLPYRNTFKDFHIKSD